MLESRPPPHVLIIYTDGGGGDICRLRRSGN